MSHHGCGERLSFSKGFQEEAGGQATMEVLVETLTGTAFEMTVSPSDTIFAIKAKICRVEGIPIPQQHLLYNLKELEDSASLRAQGIPDGARLRLVLGMRGGPISTRRQAPPAEPWADIERLLDTNRDESGWGGCKVTVVVFREGERVNLLRLRGDTHPRSHYSSSLSHLAESGDEASGPGSPTGAGAAAGAVQDAVTQGKMLELRRRMETLSVRRRQHGEEKADMDEPRGGERLSLSVPSLLECAGVGLAQPPAHAHAPARYTLLPPIAARADSDHSVQEACEVEGEERVKLSDALAGSILVAARRDRGDNPHLPPNDFGCSAMGVQWRRAFGSASALPRARPPPRPPAQISSSTSDLDTLTRNRMLPMLSRHRNTEHLHLSDDHLEVAHRPRNLEVGSERRQRRIEKIAELEASRLFRFGDFEDVRREEITQSSSSDKKEEQEEKVQTEVVEKKGRLRCGLCRKRLGAATEHRCRCGAAFCAPHRYAEVHGCAYDYKRAAQQQLRAANPLVSAPKLPKI